MNTRFSHVFSCTLSNTSSTSSCSSSSSSSFKSFYFYNNRLFQGFIQFILPPLNNFQVFFHKNYQNLFKNDYYQTQLFIYFIQTKKPLFSFIIPNSVYCCNDSQINNYRFQNPTFNIEDSTLTPFRALLYPLIKLP